MKSSFEAFIILLIMKALLNLLQNKLLLINNSIKSTQEDNKKLSDVIISPIQKFNKVISKFNTNKFFFSSNMLSRSEANILFKITDTLCITTLLDENPSGII